MQKEEVYKNPQPGVLRRRLRRKDTLISLLPIISNVKCFVDVGASLGQYTRFANRHMKNGVIYAIEPDPIRFEELERNCKKWEQTSSNRIVAVHAAVANEAGTIEFFTTNSNTSGGLFVHDVKNADVQWETTAVPAITLDAFFADKKPDFVKMDIEGAELRALQGAEGILKKKGAQFFVEIHSWADPKGQKNQNDVLQYMKGLGYSPKYIGGRPLFSAVIPEQPSAWKRVRSEARRLLRPGKNDAVSMYHQPLFNEAEKVAYRAAARARNRDGFYKAYSRLKPRRKDMMPFADKHRGERCFIMGGGPSLKKCDPKLLAKEYTFGVNGIFLLFDWLGFQPTYYAVEDWFVYEDRFGEIKRFMTEPECFFPLQFSGKGFDRPNHHYFRALYEFGSDPTGPTSRPMRPSCCGSGERSPTSACSSRTTWAFPRCIWSASTTTTSSRTTWRPTATSGWPTATTPTTSTPTTSARATAATTRRSSGWKRPTSRPEEGLRGRRPQGLQRHRRAARSRSSSAETSSLCSNGD